MLFFGGWIFIFYNESKIWNETSKKGLKSIHIAGERILVHGGKRHDQKKIKKKKRKKSLKPTPEWTQLPKCSTYIGSSDI